jgi:hypothetical protein
MNVTAIVDMYHQGSDEATDTFKDACMENDNEDQISPASTFAYAE